MPREPRDQKRNIDTRVVESYSLLSSFRVVSEAKMKFTHVFFIVIFVAGFVSALTWAMSADYFDSLLAAGYYNEDICDMER